MSEDANMLIIAVIKPHTTIALVSPQRILYSTFTAIKLTRMCNDLLQKLDRTLISNLSSLMLENTFEGFFCHSSEIDVSYMSQDISGFV